ncbi:DUF1178 family protein [Puniceibacterium sp. IMCC21224]|uniref:DUF1178 family protein n=1 Tax=Puniceibacterium sp. IMCC21224 TaxID=1618204 RepID=UPI00064DDA90|nr:DUF1178 family protein [Puniceibacterium sp. IMCC21224]KMK68310.1 hypothetical protein IMCC21224_113191 [Puniceibacterium sp. IMCC21224]
MIQYTLKCAQDHQFDSWFRSADAFETLHRTGMLACAVCGDGDVSKALMAPRVSHATQAPKARPLSAPRSAAEQALADLRAHVEKTSDYVGDTFADEARAIHDGTAPDRPIWGEARADEAKKLIEDGVPVAPLPFRPTRKTN